MKIQRVKYFCMYILLVIFLATMLQFNTSDEQYVLAAEKKPSATISKKTLYVDFNTYSIKLNNISSNSVVTYKSSNKSVATVNKEGVIYPVKKGQAVITVTIKKNKKSYTSKIKVTVKNPYVYITNKIKELELNSTYEFDVKALGLNKPDLVWSVSSKRVATIDKKTGVLTPKAKGSVKVIVKDKKSGKASACWVKIKESELVTKEVYKDSNCKITYSKVEKIDDDSIEVYFRVENYTNRTLTFQSDCISLNGESIEDIIMSDDIAPNSNGNITMDCDVDLSLIDINNIVYVGGSFRIIDFDDSNFYNGGRSYTIVYDNTKVSTKTMKSIEIDEGAVLYDDENACVSFLSAEQEGENVYVKFRFTNKTNRVLTSQLDSIAINRETSSSEIFSSDVAPHSEGNIIAECEFDMSYLDLKNIESITGTYRIIDFNNSNFYNGSRSYNVKIDSTAGYKKTETDKDSSITITPTPTATLTATPIPTPTPTPNTEVNYNFDVDTSDLAISNYVSTYLVITANSKIDIVVEGGNLDFVKSLSEWVQEGTKYKCTLSLLPTSTGTYTFNIYAKKSPENRKTLNVYVGNYGISNEVLNIESYLNKNFSEIDFGIGTWKLEHEIMENTSDTLPFDYWIKTDYTGMISPYDIEHSIKYTSEQKSEAIRKLQELQISIYEYMNANYPEKKVEGGFYSGYYKYHSLQVGYNSIQFCSWKNYSGSIIGGYNNSTVSGFTWDTDIDDNFNK